MSGLKRAVPLSAQSCLAHYLVSWVTGCGAAAVQLRVKEDCVNGCFFDLNVMQSGIRGALQTLSGCKMLMSRVGRGGDYWRATPETQTLRFFRSWPSQHAGFAADGT